MTPTDLQTQSVLKHIDVIHYNAFDKDDAEVEVVFDDRTIRVRGERAYAIAVARLKALSMLNTGRGAARRAGTDIDDIVVPYALKQARVILDNLDGC